MDTRVLILTLPSLAVLGLLVAHSWKTLPRGRAIVFWCSVIAYGVARGVALRFVVDAGLGASFPYAIRKPLFPVFGVPLQEIAGWGIVAYLGWWLGSRLFVRLFPQIVWACLFLGAISWAVEAAAVAAGWWSWSVPVSQPFFINVPAIAIVDWMFVGIDFVLPFAAITTPELRGKPVRFLTLLAFPAHFASHALTTIVAGVPLQHLAHWILIGIVVWLALRAGTTDAPFSLERRWLPLLGLAIVLVDAAAVELFLAHRPQLLVSMLPVLAVSLVAIAAGRRLAWPARSLRVAVGALAVIAVFAYVLHAGGARGQEELTRRLDAVIVARDRGDLDLARRELASLRADFPGSHVPPALLGEIDYRTEHLEQAREAFARAVAIKQDYTKGFRYLAVIDLRSGRRDLAARSAAAGLAVEPADPQLLYLAAQAAGSDDIAHRIELPDASAVLALAALAFEVGDGAGAAAYLDRGLTLWPEERSFYSSRVSLALKEGDRETAQRVVASWLARFPQDAEARQLSRQVGKN